MSTPFVSRVGGTISADIAVPEHARELRFYADVLCTGTHPLWREDLMNNLGIPVIGLGAASTAYANLPLQWMPHIQVADVAASVARALALNGSELMHGKDEDGNSQWAVLLDPNGAAFGLIPVVPAAAIPPTDATTSGDTSAGMGHIAWLTLTVADASATGDFYCQVIDWSVHAVEMEDAGGRYANYTLLGGDGNPAAAICHARGENHGLPPVWMLHLPVADLAENLRRMRDREGSAISSTAASDGAVTHAVIQDPVGAYLALVQA